MIKVKRRALIVGNMGIEKSSVSRYLVGVQDDMVNFYDFIRSDNGGAWNLDEVIFCKPNEINRKLFIDLIDSERKKSEVDFWLIYFSGHGWADKDGETYLELCPGGGDDCGIALTVLMRALGATRVLLITDACRAIPILESGGRIPQMGLYCDTIKDENNYRKACRELYCRRIMALPLDSHYIGFSCKFGETSVDSGKYGGVYTSAVLSVAKKIIETEKSKKENRIQIYAYPFIHSGARNTVLEKTYGKQTPIYVGPKTWQPPFCVIP